MWPSIPLNQALNKLHMITYTINTKEKIIYYNTSDQMERLNISYRIIKYYIHNQYKIKNAVVLESVGKGRIMLELIRKRKNKLAGPLANKELPAEGCSRRNGKWEESSRQKKISDDIQQVNGLYEDAKRKAEKRVEWRMLSLQ